MELLYGKRILEVDYFVLSQSTPLTDGQTDREKDNSNIVRHGSVFYRTGVTFFSCDLNLDPITFTYEPDPYSLEIYRIRQGFRKLMSGRQTDTTKIIYHAASRVVKKFPEISNRGLS